MTEGRNQQFPAVPLAPKPQHLREMVRLIGGYRISQCIYVAAELHLADHLSKGPRTIADLASVTDTDLDSLYRMMRMLAGARIVSETSPGTFALTELGAALRSDVPGTPSRNVRAQLHPTTWAAWGHLLQGVRTGATPFDALHGMGHFDYLTQDPAFATLFDEAMTANTKRGATAIAGSYDLFGVSTVMDVGGGRGELLAALLRANPHLNGILLEKPHVAVAAAAVFAAADLAGRARVIEGNFFAGVPRGADIYLLSHIVHDWDDARATLILTNCRNACAPDGRVLIFERILENDHVAGMAALHVDMEMMVVNGGRERTEPQHRAVIEGAGLRISRILPLPGVPDHSLIECTPAT